MLESEIMLQYCGSSGWHNWELPMVFPSSSLSLPLSFFPIPTLLPNNLIFRYSYLLNPFNNFCLLFTLFFLNPLLWEAKGHVHLTLHVAINNGRPLSAACYLAPTMRNKETLIVSLSLPTCIIQIVQVFSIP